MSSVCVGSARRKRPCGAFAPHRRIPGALVVRALRQDIEFVVRTLMRGRGRGFRRARGVVRRLVRLTESQDFVALYRASQHCSLRRIQIEH